MKNLASNLSNVKDKVVFILIITYYVIEFEVYFV